MRETLVYALFLVVCVGLGVLLVLSAPGCVQRGAFQVTVVVLAESNAVDVVVD